MSEFEFFNNLKLKSNYDSESQDDEETCPHENVATEQSRAVCIDCGMEVDDSNAKEQTSYSDDTTRCYSRKVKDKTIYQDVLHMKISEHIKDIANNIYVEACGDKVRRGSCRKGIVFAAVFHAYKVDSHPVTCDNLIDIFKIKKSQASRGLKFISENTPKDSLLRKVYITPIDIINEILFKFSVSQEKKDDIIRLYKKVENKSSLLNRARPQSLGSGIIWVWITMNNVPITIKEFTKKVGLSELTVTKMSREVLKVLDQLEGYS